VYKGGEHQRSMDLEETFIAVDSVYRDRTLYPDSGSFRVQFTTPLTDIYKIEIVSCCIPNVSYNVTEINQLFGWEEETSGVSSGCSFRIPTGHYTDSMLASEIQRLMNATFKIEKGGDWPAYATLDPFDVAYDKVHHHFVFLTKFSVFDRFRLVFGGGDCHELLGFPSGSSEWDASGFLASVTPTTIEGSAYTFMSSEELNEPLIPCLGSRYDASNVDMRAFAWFPNYLSRGFVIHHLWSTSEDVASRQKVFKPPLANLSSLQFKILDASGIILDTNGVDLDFVLRVQCFVRTDPPSKAC
jgi:hypothetical protein